jgi:competence protein ComEA
MIRTTFSFMALPLFSALVVLLAAPVAAQSKSSAAKTAATTAVVNINTATAAELEALPGVGAKTAARIVEYRQKNGPFKKIEDLMNVRGLGEKNFLKLKGQLTVGGAKTADRPQS